MYYHNLWLCNDASPSRDLVKPTNPLSPWTHTRENAYTRVYTAEHKEVNWWISPSRMFKSRCVTQLTPTMPFCLDVRGKFSSFYACRDEWLSAVNPSCKPHQRKRGHRNWRGLSNKGIIPLRATLSGSGDCWGRPVPAVAPVSSRADKKDAPLGQKRHDHSNWEGTCPLRLSEWSGFWMQLLEWIYLYL